MLVTCLIEVRLLKVKKGKMNEPKKVPTKEVTIMLDIIPLLIQYIGVSFGYKNLHLFIAAVWEYTKKGINKNTNINPVIEPNKLLK